MRVVAHFFASRTRFFEKNYLFQNQTLFSAIPLRQNSFSMSATIQSLQARIEQLEVALDALKADLYALQYKQTEGDNSLDMGSLGYTRAEALELRAILSGMAEDWDDPEMDVYNQYYN